MLEWVYLILAGLMGALGLVMIRKVRAGPNWKFIVLLIIGLGTSFILLRFSFKKVSMGTAYAIWIGISVAVDAIFSTVPNGKIKDPKILIFIAMILVAAIGLIFV